MTSCTLGDIADLVGGLLHGDPNVTILGADTIRDAGPGEITLANDPKLADELNQSQAAAVITNDSFHPASHPHIVVADVRSAFAKIVSRFRPQAPCLKAEIHPTAVVEPTASVDATAHVGANAYLGAEASIGAESVIRPGAVVSAGAKIGKQSTVGANAVLHDNTVLGDRVIIHAGAVLGAYGFGYDSSEQGHALSHQLGNVVIEDDVEIGANTTIDRATYGSTVIGQGTKVDNLVQIGHNCRIGKHNMLCSQVGIAGSVVTGDFAVMAGQVGIRDHASIGDNVRIGAKAGVKGDVPSGETYLGTPATPERLQMQLMISMQRLPEMRRAVRKMERGLEQLSSAVEKLESDGRENDTAGNGTDADSNTPEASQSQESDAKDAA
jgi:UDP-3-O-[3-hydroxymyristoyl] glucosamine N-acyltransferase